MPEEDVRTRFFQNLKSLTDTAAQHLCSVDYEREMAFAAVTGPPEHERIVGKSSTTSISRVVSPTSDTGRSCVAGNRPWRSPARPG